MLYNYVDDLTGPSSLQRKNSKRLHSNENIESVPSKQSRPEIVGYFTQFSRIKTAIIPCFSFYRGADDITEELPVLDVCIAIIEQMQYEIIGNNILDGIGTSAIFTCSSPQRTSSVASINN